MATSDIYKAPIGTKDILGHESRSWQEITSRFASLAHVYNYDLAITPTFENYEVFARVGEDTDIVTKEMYDFYDKGDRHIALKPEGTAGLVRAIAQHRPIMPVKAWYLTSVFRYERPQKGRLREHHQLGLEAFGINNPEIDVEVIQFVNEFLIGLGLTNFTLSINSLGDTQARSRHLDSLKEYFSRYQDELGEEFTLRVAKNPFRVLDTKVPEWIEVASNAPKILDYISDDSKRDFEYLKRRLDECGIEYKVVPHLVRGLDYYTNTTFEFISKSMDAAQSTICGGGRYNKLVSEMGGVETPGIGFGIGIERLLLALESENINLNTRHLDATIIDLVRNDISVAMTHDIKMKLRTNGISVDSVFDSQSVKSSMKNANRSGAKYAIIVGENEISNNFVTLKNMSSGEQSECSVDQLKNIISQ